jgi:hypothetical protein
MLAVFMIEINTTLTMFVKGSFHVPRLSTCAKGLSGKLSHAGLDAPNRELAARCDELLRHGLRFPFKRLGYSMAWRSHQL